MRAKSLSLISPMVFSIVLAQKCLSSEFATDYSPFCRKKTKESHKTANEPLENMNYDHDFPEFQAIDEYNPTAVTNCKVNQPRLGEPFISETDGTAVDKVTGFLRREHDPKRVGCYYGPYEEAFESRNSYNLVPFMDSHKYNKTIELKQDHFRPPPPKTLENQKLPKKEELPVEQKLSKKEELPVEQKLSKKEELPVEQKLPKKEELPVEQKLPKKEELPVEQKLPKKEELPVEQKLPKKEELPVEQKLPKKEELPVEQKLSKKEELPVEQKLPKLEDLLEEEEEELNTIYGENEEICEQNKQLLCTNSEETTNAIDLMTEAITHLEHHVADKDDYELCKIYDFYSMALYKKKHEGYIVHKINLRYYNFNKYNDTINELWYPAHGNSFKTGSTKKKVVRVYTPNLVMIQQRYKTWLFGRQRYFYALAAKAEISKNKTAIVMTSANINDHNTSSKEYKNTIIENANLFKTDIDSEKDIRKGKLKKVFINIAGYIIEKTPGYVDVTYIESIDGNAPGSIERVIRNILYFFDLDE
ncbi:fam-a protein [Plasmodium vinckei]|uniref:Fam-a protein n=1 Tax=Plasmodium vinckei TaxID=5860 RepID=A0A6V7SNB3_PLAVN|nr:fam-a protein [Plasmodium vinckei]